MWLDDYVVFVCGVRSDDITLCLHVVCGSLGDG